MIKPTAIRVISILIAMTFAGLIKAQPVSGETDFFGEHPEGRLLLSVDLPYNSDIQYKNKIYGKNTDHAYDVIDPQISIHDAEFGGLDPEFLAFGQQVIANPDFVTVFNGKVYLSRNHQTLLAFRNHIERSLALAEKHWSRLQAENKSFKDYASFAQQSACLDAGILGANPMCKTTKRVLIRF